MNEKNKLRLNAFIRMVFYLSIPTIIILILLNFWVNSISNDTSMEWNIFVTVACLTGAILIIVFSFFAYWVADKFFWSKFEQG